MVNLDTIFPGELLEGEELEVELDNAEEICTRGEMNSRLKRMAVPVGVVAVDHNPGTRLAPREWSSNGTHNDNPALLGGYGV